MQSPATNVRARVLHAASITADVQSANLDTIGYQSAGILAKFGTTTGTSGTVRLTVEESDNGSTGWTAIDGLDTGAITLDAGAATGNEYFFHISMLEKRKRYLRVNADASATGSPVTGAGTAIVGLLSTPQDSVKPSDEYDGYFTA